MQKVAPGTSPNLGLSLFGVTGLTSYLGMIEIGKIKAVETVAVSGAAGATGSVAGQIAKIKGCRVIGPAGGKDKCDWRVNEGHSDGAIDYKSEDVGARLSELCPNGILRQRRRRGPQRGPRSDQPQRAHRAVRLDLEVRRRHAAARPGELLQSGGAACAHGGLHRARLSHAGPRGLRGAGPLAARRQPRAQGGRRVWPRECAESADASVCRRELRKAAGESRRCSRLGDDRGAATSAIASPQPNRGLPRSSNTRSHALSNTLKLYHSASSPNSRRVRIFLAEKGLALSLVPVDLGEDVQRPYAFRCIIPRQ